MKRFGILSGLSGRLISAFIGVVVIMMLVLAAVVPQLARSYELTALENRLADESGLVADYVAFELDHGITDLDVLAKRLGQRTDTRITIIALDGTVLGESHQDLIQVGNHAGRREVQQALAEGRGVDLHLSETVGYEMLYVAVPIAYQGGIIGTARSALPISEINRMVGDLTRAILFAALGGGALAVIVAMFAARAINRPLAELTRMAATLADDPLHPGQVRRSDGPAEVAQLSKTLARMTTAIQDSLRRVEAERDRLDAILDNLADGVVMVESDGHVALLNATAQRLLGIGRLAKSGHTVAEVLRDHELIELVEQTRLASVPTVVESRFLELRNPRRFIRAAVSRFGFGRSHQTLLVLQDFTELQRLESVRRDFVANVSHELRTPIASIKIMSETLQDGAIDDPDIARDFLGRIEGEVDGLHRLVEELLELSRLESDSFSVSLVPVDPPQLIEDGVRRLAAMAERAKVSLTVEIAAELPPVLADPERIGQVFVNLIHNAVKFTPAGGTIAVRAVSEGDHVRFSVADTGIGIESELLTRVFERFYKADQARAGGGTGLGLAIAKHTIQLHSGKIWAESAGPGRGTTVHVSLPVVPAVLSSTTGPSADNI